MMHGQLLHKAPQFGHRRGTDRRSRTTTCGRLIVPFHIRSTVEGATRHLLATSERDKSGASVSSRTTASYLRTEMGSGSDFIKLHANKFTRIKPPHVVADDCRSRCSHAPIFPRSDDYPKSLQPAFSEFQQKLVDVISVEHQHHLTSVYRHIRGKWSAGNTQNSVKGKHGSPAAVHSCRIGLLLKVRCRRQQFSRLRRRRRCNDTVELAKLFA